MPIRRQYAIQKKRNNKNNNTPPCGLLNSVAVAVAEVVQDNNSNALPASQPMVATRKRVYKTRKQKKKKKKKRYLDCLFSFFTNLGKTELIMFHFCIMKSFHSRSYLCLTKICFFTLNEMIVHNGQKKREFSDLWHIQNYFPSPSEKVEIFEPRTTGSPQYLTHICLLHHDSIIFFI